MLNICVVGTGYVGLVTGACLAAMGNQVICTDNDQAKIRRLQNGDNIIYEPGLAEILAANLHEGRLIFSKDTGYGIENSPIIFITVGTPADRDGSTDLGHVFSAVEEVGKYINADKHIIIKSTVPVGTNFKIKSILSRIQMERKTGFRCEVVSNPEFLREGSAVNDFMYPDRIVVGTDNSDAVRLLRKIYLPVMCNAHCQLLIMDPPSAEISKYAANYMLAARISFINELAKLCDMTGADITKIARGIGSDHRIGPSFLQAGLGYGGSCFPKDIKSLGKTFSAYGLNSDLIAAVDQINQNQPHYFVNKIKAYFGSELRGKVLAVWGLTFKPETDDLRKAPSLAVIKELLAAGTVVKAFDPQLRHTAKEKEVSELTKSNLLLCNDQYEILKEAEALIVVTEWDCFKNPDFPKMKELMREKVIFDGRNIFEPTTVRNCGFHYYGVGRC
jgi:UDPglucose 6-dehydrogenase